MNVFPEVNSDPVEVSGDEYVKVNEESGICAVTPPGSPPPTETPEASDIISVIRRDGQDVLVLPKTVLITFKDATIQLLSKYATLNASQVESGESVVAEWFNCLVDDDVAAAAKLAKRYPTAVTGSFYDADESGVSSSHHLPTLCVACLLGSAKVVEFILRLKLELASASCTALFSTPPSHFAASSNSVSCLRQLLPLLPPTAATAVNGRGDSILHMACEVGASDVVSFLIGLLLSRHGSKGALTRVVLGLNSRSLSPLHVAVAHGYQSCVEALLSSLPVPLARACANQAGVLDLTPLHMCSFGGKENRDGMLDIAKSILAHGGDPGGHSSVLLSTPLHFSCRVGFSQLVSLLLKSSATPNAKDDRGMTPLHVAVKYGNVVCAMLCTQEGADGTVRDDRGRSAVHIAAGVAGGKECLLYLLAVGPKMKDAKDDEGRMPILEAIEGGLLDNLQVLLRAGARVTDVAVAKAKECLVTSYLGNGEDVNILTEMVKMIESCLRGMEPKNIKYFAKHENEVAELFQRSMVKAAGSKKVGSAIASRILGFVGRGWIAEDDSNEVTTAMALSRSLKKTAECLSSESDNSDSEGEQGSSVVAVSVQEEATTTKKKKRQRRVTAESWDGFEKPAPRTSGKRRKELKDFARIKNRFGI
mmetsp:Transcript_21431/g.44646  ORF Transcript_21431/g.44646 Transcript_21431/m.44646 type:complete len:648 (-) Transcript_21431:72-2015(-)